MEGGNISIKGGVLAWLIRCSENTKISLFFLEQLDIKNCETHYRGEVYLLLGHLSLVTSHLSIVSCCNLLLICNFLSISELMNECAVPLVEGPSPLKSR